MNTDYVSLKNQIKKLDTQIDDLNRRIPPHGIKPSMIAELDELEMQRNKLLQELAKIEK